MWSASLALGSLYIVLFHSVQSRQVYLEEPRDSRKSDDIFKWQNDIAAHEETDNLIFSTISSLLQQWPNTRYRNGHTIAGGTIPVGTVLYHGGGDQNVPETPEWLAFNVEHSYVLCPAPECWMLTFSVEEELNVIYLDGSSAANSIFGHQDSQDLLIWGEPRPDKLWFEWERLLLLCRWGEQRGLDAIVRMEPGFEVMLCDFKKKTKLVSSLHIMAPKYHPPPVVPGLAQVDQLHYRQRIRQSAQGVYDIATKNVHLLSQDSQSKMRPFPEPQTHPSPTSPPPNPPPVGSPEPVLSTSQTTSFPPWPPWREPGPQPLPPGWTGPLRNPYSVNLEAVHAASWNNFYPGEARVKIDYTRLISFYDPAYPSLVTARQGMGRAYHRLTNISRTDYERAMGDLDGDLSRADKVASGVDWSTLTRTVTDQYADRLRLLKGVIVPHNLQHRNITKVALSVREHLMIMLTPYLIYGAVPSSGTQDSRNTSWVEPIKQQCATALTSRIKVESLTRSERMIKAAMEGVLNRICSTLTGMWVDAISVSTVSENSMVVLVDTWQSQLESLMTWLDWPMWDICQPACSEEMFCYIPTWPWGLMQDTTPDLDMTPRCIDRVNGRL